MNTIAITASSNSILAIDLGKYKHDLREDMRSELRELIDKH
jgi:hypothetical protein